MDWTAVAIVFATMLGPVLAVWASEIRQRQRQDQDRKEWVFRTLWSTRSVPLQPEHVSALNHIDFAFPAKDYPMIADAWRLYQAHLHSDQGLTEDSIVRWGDKAGTLLFDLIHLMASDLQFPFPKSMVNQPSYYPKAYATNEARQIAMQSALLELS